MQSLINKPSKENKIMDLTVRKVGILYSSRVGARPVVEVEMILNYKREDRMVSKDKRG